MYKHYIKIDENDMIIDAFSSAFRQLEGGEILVADTNERHFNLQLKDNQGVLQYKWQDPDIAKIDIPQRPSEYHDWDGSAWIVNLDRTKMEVGAFVRNTARAMLDLSNCIVHRHIDEIADGGSTRITQTKYEEELAHRRELREHVDGRITEMEGTTQLNDILDIKSDIVTRMNDEKERYKC